MDKKFLKKQQQGVQYRILNTDLRAVKNSHQAPQVTQPATPKTPSRPVSSQNTKGDRGGDGNSGGPSGGPTGSLGFDSSLGFNGLSPAAPGLDSNIATAKAKDDVISIDGVPVGDRSLLGLAATALPAGFAINAALGNLKDKNAETSLNALRDLSRFEKDRFKDINRETKSFLSKQGVNVNPNNDLSAPFGPQQQEADNPSSTGFQGFSEDDMSHPGFGFEANKGSRRGGSDGTGNGGAAPGQGNEGAGAGDSGSQGEGR